MVLRCPYCDYDVPGLALKTSGFKRCPGCGERVWRSDAKYPPRKPDFQVDAETSGHGA